MERKCSLDDPGCYVGIVRYNHDCLRDLTVILDNYFCRTENLKVFAMYRKRRS